MILSDDSLRSSDANADDGNDWQTGEGDGELSPLRADDPARAHLQAILAAGRERATLLRAMGDDETATAIEAAADYWGEWASAYAFELPQPPSY